MANPGVRTFACKARPVGVLAALTFTLMLGACAQVGDVAGPGLLSGIAPELSAAPQEPAATAQHWAKAYSDDPASLEAALGYARALKAQGEKTQALTVLKQAAVIHPMDKTLASEYGRLALELDQITLAKRLLELADDPTKPDWRVVMARGTALAKEGRYKEATGFFERALALQPEHPSVLSNLALAHTMSGNAEKGEALLRRAAEQPDVSPKVRQNLALVLGLQGKYEEATKIGSVDLPPDRARENTDLIRQMVKIEAKPALAPQLPSDAWETQTIEVSEVRAEAPARAPTRAQAVAAPGHLALRPSSH